MQGQTADKTVLRIRIGWVPGIVAGAGLALTVLGLTPAQATSSGGTGTHQSYVCRYVGNSLRLASGVNPALLDIAGAQEHHFMDDPHNGHVYVLVANSGRLDSPPSITLCPGYTPPPTTTSTTSTTTGPTVTPSGSSTTSSTSGTTTSSTTSSTSSSSTSSTTSTTTEPTVSASASSTTSSGTSTTTEPTVSASASSTTSSTTSTTTQPTVSTTSTTSSPTTSPTVTAKPVVHSTGTPKPPAATSHRSISDPAANAVPLAATDGADLAGEPVPSPRDGILASGLLLMMAGGVLSTRRPHAQ